MANIVTKVGYAQVEPNRLTAQKTREIFSQLPADSAIAIIENGMFLYYDESANKVTLPKKNGGFAQLVMNEIILADERYQKDSDYVMAAAAATDYQASQAAYPRLYGMHVGDSFTTNAVELTTAGVMPVAGDQFIVDATTGYLMPIGATAAADCDMIFQVPTVVVGKTDCLADGQAAVKFVCIKA